MTAQMTLSAFVQAPTKGLRCLDDGQEVVLTRRDGEDLRIQRERDARGKDECISQVSHVFARLLIAHEAARVVEAMLEEYPWMSLLDESEATDFAREYLATVRACASLGNYVALETVTNAWMATARLKADPDLARRVQRRIEDEQPVVAHSPRSSQRSR